MISKCLKVELATHFNALQKSSELNLWEIIMQKQQIARLEHNEDRRSQNLQSSTGSASVQDQNGVRGIDTNNEQQPNSNYHAVSIGQNSYNISGDEHITRSLIKSVQEVVTDILCLAVAEFQNANRFIFLFM
jgi:hypothetical protein